MKICWLVDWFFWFYQVLIQSSFFFLFNCLLWLTHYHAAIVVWLNASVRCLHCCENNLKDHLLFLPGILKWVSFWSTKQFRLNLTTKFSNHPLSFLSSYVRSSLLRDRCCLSVLLGGTGCFILWERQIHCTPSIFSSTAKFWGVKKVTNTSWLFASPQHSSWGITIRQGVRFCSINK